MDGEVVVFQYGKHGCADMSDVILIGCIDDVPCVFFRRPLSDWQDGS